MNETESTNTQTPLNIWIFALNVAGGCVFFGMNIVTFLEANELVLADIGMGAMLGLTLIAFFAIENS